MGFFFKRLTVGSRINRAIRALLALCVYCILGIFLIGIIVFSFMIMQANQEVGSRFSEVRWSLPARVYARPLELYVGSDISLAQVKLELNLVNYRETDRLNRPGSYRIGENQIDLFTRAFTYSDGTEPSRKFTVYFNQEGVSQIKNADGTDITIVRLEPAEIASIYPQHNEDRILLSRDELPPALVDALLAMEDRSFYHHMGVNPKAIIRAMIVNARAGKNIQGGSTLTQQLVKNYFLTDAKTLSRKMKEALYSIVIDYRYPKDAILEAYINEIYLGQDGARAIHGFGLASQFYFGRPIDEIGIHQIALLVGILPAPAAYNPRRSYENALKRRNLVLDVMLERNLLSEADTKQLKMLPLDVLERPKSSHIRYPAFIDLVNRQIKTLYTKDDLATEGLKIFTTLDPITQQKAEESIKTMLPVLERSKRQPKDAFQGAFVVLRTQTNEVEAIVGDRDVTRLGFNRALNAKRQIGSLIKAVIYLRALEEPKRFNLAYQIDGSAIRRGEFGNWTPRNYSRNLTHSRVALMTSLAKSYNIPTVRLGMSVGVQEIINTLYRLGLNPLEYDIPAFPSVLLGAIELTPLDVAQIYATIANGGYMSKINAIREVTTAEGRSLVQNISQPEQAVYADRNFLAVRALQEVVNNGTGASIKSALKVKGVAGKTGTTDDYRDSWFAGFTGDRVTVAWVGRDDNKSTGLSGSQGGLRLWVDLMKKLKLQDVEPTVPNSIVFTRVNMSSGQLPDSSGSCGGAVMSLPFVRGFQPTAVTTCGYYSGYEDFPPDE